MSHHIISDTNNTAEKLYGSHHHRIYRSKRTNSWGDANGNKMPLELDTQSSYVYISLATQADTVDIVLPTPPDYTDACEN